MEVSIALDQKITGLQQDMHHTHYMLRKLARNEPITEEDLQNERITQYIPCQTYRELQNLEEKLDSNERFMKHAVRKLIYNVFLIHPFTNCLSVYKFGLRTSCGVNKEFYVKFLDHM